MVKLRSSEEIARISESAAIVAGTLELLGGLARPGVTTRELDNKGEEYIRDHGGEPSFLGYHGYPASTCISINEQVVHGIPGDREIKDGDIVGIDVGVCKNGYHGDAATTVAVGGVPERIRKLMEVTEECLRRAIESFRPGNRLGDIGHAVQAHAEAHGYGVVRNLVGHGIGEKMHEDPQVPNYGDPGTGLRLKPGMVFAIEPMVTLGGWEVETLSDRWTIVTRDGSPAAHYEHTVALTEDGPRVLSIVNRRGGETDPAGQGMER